MDKAQDIFKNLVATAVKDSSLLIFRKDISLLGALFREVEEAKGNKIPM